MIRVDAVVFDLDGVLIDSEVLHCRAWRDVLAGRGTEAELDWFRCGIGMSDLTFWSTVVAEFGLDAAHEGAVLAEKEVLLQACLDAGELGACAGADALLRRLGPLARVGMATSSPRPFVDFVLKQFGWMDLFATTVSRSEVEHAKPFPDLYAKAARDLGVAPGNCLAIEDSPTGLEAALAAGLRTVGVTTNLAEANLLAAGAEFVISSLDEIQLRMENGELRITITQQ